MGYSTIRINDQLALGAWSATTPAPAAPTNLRQTAITSSTSTLAWDSSAPTGSAYTLQRATVTNGVAGAFSTVYTNTAKTFQDSGLTFQGIYDYRVLVTVNGAASAYSTPLRITVGAKRIVYLIRFGTSITRADGAAVAAGFRPADTYDAADSYQQAQGAKANEGRQTSVEKAADLYLTPQFGATHEFRTWAVGYPSMTGAWYTDTHLATAFNGLDTQLADDIIVILEWGANDPADRVQARETGLPVDSAAEVRYQAQQFKAKSPKVRVIASPPANRANYPKYDNFGVWRYQRSQLDYAATVFDEVVNVEAFDFGKDAAPLTWSNSNAAGTYFYDNAGHLNGNGTDQDALAEAQAVARLLGKTLSQGNGTRPVAKPAATIAINPASGVSTVSRTATLSTGATVTNPKLYRVNPSGLTYAPTLVGSGTSVSFAPSDTASYYFTADLSPSSYLVTYPNATAAVTNGSGGGPVTEQVNMPYRQWFAKLGDGRLQKNGGNTDSRSAQACANRRITKDSLAGTTLRFTDTRANLLTGHEYDYGFANGPAAPGLANSSVIFGWRINKDTLVVRINGDIKYSQNRTAASSIPTITHDGTNLTFYDDSAAVYTMPAPVGADLYINSCASVNGTTIPVATITSSGLIDNVMTPFWAVINRSNTNFFEKDPTDWGTSGSYGGEAYTNVFGSPIRIYVEDLSQYPLSGYVDGNSQMTFLVDGNPVATLDGTTRPVGVQVLYTFTNLVGGHFLSVTKTAPDGFFIDVTSGQGTP